MHSTRSDHHSQSPYCAVSHQSRPTVQSIIRSYSPFCDLATAEQVFGVTLSPISLPSLVTIIPVSALFFFFFNGGAGFEPWALCLLAEHNPLSTSTVPPLKFLETSFLSCLRYLCSVPPLPRLTECPLVPPMLLRPTEVHGLLRLDNVPLCLHGTPSILVHF